MYVVRLKPALLEIRSMDSTKRTFLRPQGWKDPKKKGSQDRKPLGAAPLLFARFQDCDGIERQAYLSVYSWGLFSENLML